MRSFLQYLSEQKRRLNSDYIDLFHGTVAHPVDFTRGIETQRGKGIYGSQGPGFSGRAAIAVLWYRDWETDRKSTRLNSSH